MRIAERKESPIIGLTGIGGGLASYILYGGSGSSVYEISRSLRFSSDDSAYLSDTPTYTGDRRRFTWTSWVKRSKTATNNYHYLFATSNVAGNNYSSLFFDSSDDTLVFTGNNGSGSVQFNLKTSAIFRDISAWYHIVLSVDSSQATASNKVKIYVNGEQITSFSTETYPPDGFAFRTNSINEHNIGKSPNFTTYFDGYLADTYFVDGQTLAAADFGETDEYGIWNPKEYTGTYYTTTSTATGALPIHTTTDIYGETKGSGNRTDANAANLVLAISGNGSYQDISADIKGSGTNKTVSLNSGGSVTISASEGRYYSGGSIDFDGASADYLTIPNSADFQFGTGDFTVEFWIKTTDTAFNPLYQSVTGGSNAWSSVVVNNNAPLFWQNSAGAANLFSVETFDSLIDGQWHHVAYVRNSGTTTPYIDGVAIGTAGGYTDNTNYAGTGGNLQIGLGANGSLNGYLQDIRIYKGVAKYTSNFSIAGRTNSFHFKYDDNTSTTTLGADSSSNSNNWTLNNFSVASGSGNDSLLDSPTNYEADSGNNGGNYATLNPLHGKLTLSNGNLDSTSPSDWKGSAGTIGMSSGKWYWEIDNVTGNEHVVGIVKEDVANITWNTTYGYGAETGVKYLATGGVSYGDAWTTGDIIGVAFDADAGSLTFYKDGVSQGVAATGLTDGPYLPSVVHNGSSRSSSINFGQRPWTYTPPTGHVALCTQNLPTPAISKGSEHVGVSTWTGTDISAANTITGLEFSPDLIWSKSRSHAYNHQLVDTIRGGNKTITSVNTSEEVTDEQYGYINTFNSDGFTSTPGSGDNDYYNGTGKTYVAWTWNAGGTASKTYTVKVVSDSGNKYRFDDFGTSAVTLDLEEGGTYVFDSSDSSVDSHPFVLGTSANSGEYSTGVTYTLDGVEKTYAQYTSGFAAATTRKLTITVPSGAPTLYYWCSVHSGMGGQVNTNSTAGSSNFDGAKQSTVKANPTAGFSIIKYTTSNADTVSQATFGTGLSGTPEMVLMKPLYDGGQGWTVYHKDIDEVSSGNRLQDYLHLDTDARSTDSGVDTFATTTSAPYTFGCRGSRQVVGNDRDIIVYAWTSIPGYSKIGYYTGNGLSDGPYVYTGMSPRFILFKRADSAGDNWTIFDTERDSVTLNIGLQPNLALDEQTFGNRSFEVKSNGFKVTSTGSSSNASNGIYVFAAYAEHPLKTVRAV